jgi:hypothetical protein
MSSRERQRNSNTLNAFLATSGMIAFAVVILLLAALLGAAVSQL